MGNTTLGYGSTYTPELILTVAGTTTILPALLNSRYELDHLRVNVEALDPGGEVTVGFGSASTSPSVFDTLTSNVNPYDQHFDQPGMGNPGVANQALTITITGGNIIVRVKCGYHVVPVTILPASVTGPN